MQCSHARLSYLFPGDHINWKVVNIKLFYVLLNFVFDNFYSGCFTVHMILQHS